MSLISLQNVSKIYGEEDARTVALESMSIDIDAGEFVAIMGPSGSGKSTLMNMVGLLDRPTTGTYMLEDKDVSTLKDKKLAELRREKIGFVFQNFNLLQRHTALENVSLPMVYKRASTRERLHAAAELLEKVGLGDRMHHMPNELSGGQMQRVAIARALANSPSLILADEPTGNLDSKSGAQIIKQLNQLHKDGNTIIIVTHDEEVALQAKRIVRLRDGRLDSDEPVKAKKTTKKAKSTKKKSSKKKTEKKDSKKKPKKAKKEKKS